MKTAVYASAILLALVTGQPFAAQVCGAPGQAASATDITTLLTNRYACATRGSEYWNELHQGGNVIDYKRGPTDPKDPSKTVGTYIIATGGGNNYDTVTYTYPPSGGSYSYAVTPKGQTTPGTYTFCNTATGELFTVTVQAAHCAVLP